MQAPVAGSWTWRLVVIGILSLAVVGGFVVPVGAQQSRELTFERLPKSVRDQVEATRKECRDLNPQSVSDYAMAGIAIVDIEGDGSSDILVDNRDVCSSRMAGANCTNRGCDLAIFKQTGPARWTRVLSMHAHDRFISRDWETGRLRIIIVSIYAGDPRCKPPKNHEFPSGKSCDVIGRYRAGRWIWEKVD